MLIETVIVLRFHYKHIHHCRLLVHKCNFLGDSSCTLSEVAAFFFSLCFMCLYLLLPT